MPLPAYLSPEARECLEASGVEGLFPVQEIIYPHIVAAYKGRVQNDTCVCSPTGSGKTLAYVLPLVETLKGRRIPQLRAVIVTPRKELAKQVFKTLRKFTQGAKLTAQLMSGEELFKVDKKRYLAQTPDIVVATPARLVEMMAALQDGFSLAHLRYLVLDESDLLLSDATQDWLRGTLSKVDADVAALGQLNPPPLHRLLFSATLTHNMAKLNQVRLVNPKQFQLASDGQTLDNVQRYAIPDTLEERVEMCGSGMKILALRKLLLEEPGTVLVFTRTTEAAHRLARILQLMGAQADEFSGQLTQSQRAQVVQNLRLGVSTCGVCSDALARGIDVDRVSLVVNYEIPTYIQTYIHRVGRTARAGRSGSAVTLIESEEEHADFLALRRKAHTRTEAAQPTLRQQPEATSNHHDLLKDSLAVLQSVLLKEKKGLLCPFTSLPSACTDGIAKKHPTLVIGKKKELHRVVDASRKRKREESEVSSEQNDDEDDGSEESAASEN
eukprot:Rhum_TRINITY_DN7673_c0_g2::Rhum_TRINITY_DN7673_c0_g2_i1::g.24138::m.24138/K14807/DDX51, DBP6; ATP-dependent RNA helicase DDX51/DBP6